MLSGNKKCYEENTHKGRGETVGGLNWRARTSLEAQWLRIHLPMQGTQVWALLWEDPTGCGATKPGCYNAWAHVPVYGAQKPGACARQQEKPTKWEARAPQ